MASGQSRCGAICADRERARIVTVHREISFEDEICVHLAAHGWLYADGHNAGYGRARVLCPADVIAWVQATQPRRVARTRQESQERCNRELLNFAGLYEGLRVALEGGRAEPAS